MDLFRASITNRVLFMTEWVMQLFERSGFPPEKEKVKPSIKKQKAVKEERSLVCKACGLGITTDRERISVSGQHVHTCRNPAGYVYSFGCFRNAPGCRISGEASLEHTWFAGYRWEIAVCAACGAHLGWRFSNHDGFYGLIVDRLMETQ
jgi:hypothetical protein